MSHFALLDRASLMHCTCISIKQQSLKNKQHFDILKWLFSRMFVKNVMTFVPISSQFSHGIFVKLLKRGLFAPQSPMEAKTCEWRNGNKSAFAFITPTLSRWWQKFRYAGVEAPSSYPCFRLKEGILQHFAMPLWRFSKIRTKLLPIPMFDINFKLTCLRLS